MIEGEEALLHVMGQERGGGPKVIWAARARLRSAIAAESATIGIIGMRLHATY
jgi:hypothetical protein